MYSCYNGRQPKLLWPKLTVKADYEIDHEDKMYESISSQLGKKISYRERNQKISVMSERKGHSLEIVTVREGLVKVLTNGCTFTRRLSPPGGKGG